LNKAHGTTKTLTKDLTQSDDMRFSALMTAVEKTPNRR